MRIWLERDGACHLPAIVKAHLRELRALVESYATHGPGVRITGNGGLRAFLAADGPIGSIIAALLGPLSRPVRAVLFDKTEASNWSLGWHQDRTICVKQRAEVSGFGGWTVKQGLVHATPPFALLERMLTMRIHLDNVPPDNAPLLVARGSHLLGLVPEPAIDEAVRRCGNFACLAEAGDAWLCATPILHASAASATPGRRRVLQVDYAGENLPGGLEWLGV